MKINIQSLVRKSILASLGVCCVNYLPAAAADVSIPRTAQICQLGNVCKIPGDDGGLTVFSIAPENGMHYVCQVRAKGGSLKFRVSSGKDFKITQGSSLYNASPDTTVKIDGRFAKPNDPHEAGEIRFTKLPFSTADGEVECQPAKS